MIQVLSYNLFFDNSIILLESLFFYIFCFTSIVTLQVVIKNIKNLKDSVEVYAELLISEQTCPCCSTKTSKIHDHYVQPIKDIPIHLKPTTIFL